VIRQRWALPGLAIIAALALGAAGCTNGTPTPASSPSASGTDVLNAAVAKTKGKSYHFNLTYGTALTGDGDSSGDGAATSMNITLADAVSGVTVKVGALVLPSDAYAKVDLGPAAGAMIGISPDTWLHIDPAKAPGAARLGIKPGVDIFGPDTYVKGVATATVSSPTEVTGTLDLSKSAPPGVASTEAAKLDASQRVVPFTATLDDQGRISKIVVKLPAIGVSPASDLTSTYSNWGVAVDQNKPPADKTVEAPALLYTFLG
jgi:hypothetical protein